MNEKLVKEVVRILRECEDYYNREWLKAEGAGQGTSASLMLGKTLAYESARQMLMAALTGNEEILREYDYFGKKENPTE